MSSATVGAVFVALGAAAALVGIGVVAFGLLGIHQRWWRDARWLAFATLGFSALSIIWMERALITRDFTVEFVAQHGSHQTSSIFNIATMWSALEGSILLWTFILCGYLVAVVVKFKGLIPNLQVL